MTRSKDMHLSTLRRELPDLSEVVVQPMRDGILGRDNPQPCEPQDRSFWLIVGLIGERDSDWVPLHHARGMPSFASPEAELVDTLQLIELPVTILLHPERVGPCETLRELTAELTEFIHSGDVEGHPLSAARVHPLAPLHAALMLAVVADSRATDPGTPMLR